MNIEGTKKVLNLCKKMSKLEALVHVSTAYANCDRKQIDEIIYRPSVTPDHLLNLAEWMSDSLVAQITPRLIHPRPNTYTFTKAIAETVVAHECSSASSVDSQRFLPCAIVRPSIVGCAWQEPLPGWIDNLNGATGVFAAVGKGVLRTILSDHRCTADIVPVEYPVNTMIVAAWEMGKMGRKTEETNEKNKKVKVYNCTSGQLNKITWEEVHGFVHESLRKNPFENVYWADTHFTMNKYILEKRFILTDYPFIHNSLHKEPTNTLVMS
jgi:fatty acyl-CoA reductase